MLEQNVRKQLGLVENNFWKWVNNTLGAQKNNEEGILFDNEFDWINNSIDEEVKTESVEGGCLSVVIDISCFETLSRDYGWLRVALV